MSTAKSDRAELTRLSTDLETLCKSIKDYKLLDGKTVTSLWTSVVKAQHRNHRKGSLIKALHHTNTIEHQSLAICAELLAIRPTLPSDRGKIIDLVLDALDTFTKR